MEPARYPLNDEMDARYAAFRERFGEANRDIALRVQALGVTVAYEMEADWLVLAFGPAGPAGTFERDDFTFLRYDVSTLKIMGIEFLPLARHLAAHPREAAILDVFVALARTVPDGAPVSLPASALSRLAEAANELVAV